ncbi:MAG: cation diffusion facilitator family transporter [Acidimicrobiales bacterium]
MDRSTRLRVALGINVALVVGQVIFGLTAHSVGLLADAGHNLSDVAALGVSLVAVVLAQRAANERKSFGYHRATILAAQVNAASILTVTGLLAWGAIVRLIHPADVEGTTVAIVAAVAFAANLATVRVLNDHSRDLNMRAALLHMVGDAAASVAVFAAGVVIAVTGGYARLDPIASLVVSALIAWRAVGLLRETTDVLLESTPENLDTAAILAAIAGTPGVESVHDLHTWSLSSEVAALSAHVVLDGHPSLEEAQVVAARVKTRLTREFTIAHATLEVECETCGVDERDPCAITTTPAERLRH